MWLWNKFWHTDIVGKTYILIILFIVVVTIMCLVTRTKNEMINNKINNENKNEIVYYESTK